MQPGVRNDTFDLVSNISVEFREPHGTKNFGTPPSIKGGPHSYAGFHRGP